MRIATWNVNSLPSRVGQLHTWLVERDIDVALMQSMLRGTVEPDAVDS